MPWESDSGLWSPSLHKNDDPINSNLILGIIFQSCNWGLHWEVSDDYWVVTQKKQMHCVTPWISKLLNILYITPPLLRHEMHYTFYTQTQIPILLSTPIKHEYKSQQQGSKRGQRALHIDHFLKTGTSRNEGCSSAGLTALGCFYFVSADVLSGAVGSCFCPGCSLQFALYSHAIVLFGNKMSIWPPLKSCSSLHCVPPPCTWNEISWLGKLKHFYWYLQ